MRNELIMFSCRLRVRDVNTVVAVLMHVKFSRGRIVLGGGQRGKNI